MLNCSPSAEYHLVNDHINPRLESALRAIIYSPSERNRDAFLRELLAGHLIILSNSIKSANEEKQSLCLSDDEGFSYYRKNTTIPVVQLHDHQGNLILPAFSNSTFLQQYPLAHDYMGINTLAVSVFEMACAAGSSKIIINPETELCVEIDRPLIKGIIECLQDGDILDGNGFKLNSIESVANN